MPENTKNWTPTFAGRQYIKIMRRDLFLSWKKSFKIIFPSKALWVWYLWLQCLPPWPTWGWKPLFPPLGLRLLLLPTHAPAPPTGLPNVLLWRLIARHSLLNTHLVFMSFKNTPTHSTRWAACTEIFLRLSLITTLGGKYCSHPHFVGEHSKQGPGRRPGNGVHRPCCHQVV